MEKKQTNYQLYERLGYLLKAKKPWSKDYADIIKQLELGPDYPMDDPLIIDLINFALDEIHLLAPHITKRVDETKHILEVNFQTLDSFHYNLLATHLYDLSDHLYGLKSPHLPADELKKRKVKSMARLLESLAAICVNNAQII
jgi:hypothetical protein